MAELWALVFDGAFLDCEGDLNNVYDDVDYGDGWGDGAGRCNGDGHGNGCGYPSGGGPSGGGGSGDGANFEDKRGEVFPVSS